MATNNSKVAASQQDELDQIAQSITADQVCPELAATATQLVFGDGPADAEVVFIGEAPGKHEDEQGKPFVGAAGKFLQTMLESIGWQRSDVYITNIVKYRPPNNRDPLPAEKKAFWPYLVRQLNVIRPKLVVTLGRHSMEYFLPGQKISAIHGQPKRISLAQPNNSSGTKLVVLPLYHPAAALYNGGQRQMLLDDFLIVPRILKQL